MIDATDDDIDDVFTPNEALEVVKLFFLGMEADGLSDVEQMLVVSLALAVACESVKMPNAEAHQNFERALGCIRARRAGGGSLN